MKELEIVFEVGDRVEYHTYPADTSFTMDHTGAKLFESDRSKPMAFYAANRVICIRRKPDDSL